MKKPIVKHLKDRTRVDYVKVNIFGRPSYKTKLNEPRKTKRNWGDIFTKGFVAAVFVWMISLALYGATENLANAMVGPAYVEMPYKIETFPPILQKICKAESGGKHFKKDGKTVQTNKNKNGTIDVGVCQINSIHHKTAEKMGLDVYNEKDNKEFALYLFNTQGSVPWASSAGGKNGWLK